MPTQCGGKNAFALSGIAEYVWVLRFDLKWYIENRLMLTAAALPMPEIICENVPKIYVKIS